VVKEEKIVSVSPRRWLLTRYIHKDTTAAFFCHLDDRNKSDWIAVPTPEVLPMVKPQDSKWHLHHWNQQNNKGRNKEGNRNAR
jgi:hypothetical protein